MVETISGRRVNVFDRSDISLLGRNAAKVDALLEHEVGMFLAGEKRLKREVEHQQIKQKYEDAVRRHDEFKEYVRKNAPQAMPKIPFSDDLEEARAQLAKNELIMKNKRTSDMIMKNLNKLLKIKKIAKVQFKLDLSNKIDSIVDEWNYYAKTMARDEEWIQRTYENPEDSEN